MSTTSLGFIKLVICAVVLLTAQGFISGSTPANTYSGILGPLLEPVRIGAFYAVILFMLYGIIKLIDDINEAAKKAKRKRVSHASKDKADEQWLNKKTSKQK